MEASVFLPSALGVAASVLSIGGVGVLVLGWGSSRDNAHFRRRFERLLGVAAQASSEPRRGLVRFVARLGRDAGGSGKDREISRLLVQAGYRGRDPMSVFRAIRLALPLLSVGALAVTWWLAELRVGWGLVVGLYVAVAMGFLLPRLVLVGLAHARQARIGAELLPMVHLFRILYECGLSTSQVIQVAASEAEELAPEVTRELREVTRRVWAGSELSRALYDVSKELDLNQLYDVVAVIRQIERYGGAVGPTLLGLASNLEDAERARLQLRVSRASAQMTVVMVLCLLPALLVMLAGPGFASLIQGLRRVHG